MQPHKTTVVSHEIMEAELLRRGYTLERIDLHDNFSCYQSPGGRTWFTRDAKLSYPFVTGTARLICKDKQISQLFAASRGVATANMMVLPQPKARLMQFLTDNAPVVVKPLDSYGAHGITLNVSDEAGLAAAVAEARTCSDGVMLQRQFDGEEIRITIIRGEFAVAINRRTPRVVGDGRSSIAELIQQENTERAAISFSYLSYPQLTEEIIPEHWLTDQRVPAGGEIIELSRNVLAARGGTFHDISDVLHQDYKAIAVSLVNVLNPDFLVVDLLVKDYTAPASKDNYMFLEFTTSPALYVYYSVRDGQQYDIVRRLADMIDEYCSPNGSRRTHTG